MRSRNIVLKRKRDWREIIKLPMDVSVTAGKAVEFVEGNGMKAASPTNEPGDEITKLKTLSVFSR
jgi:hypothetical protein